MTTEPYSLQHERACLAVLLSGTNANIWALFQQYCPDPQAFTDGNHRLIVLAAKRVADSGLAIDILSITDALDQWSWDDAYDELSSRPRPARIQIGGGHSALTAMGTSTVSGISILHDIMSAFGLASGLKQNLIIVAAYHRLRMAIAAADSLRDRLDAPGARDNLDSILEAASTTLSRLMTTETA